MLCTIFSVNGQCYDSKSRPLPLAFHAGKLNSVDYCRTYCYEMAAIYAGVEAWDWCFCGIYPAPASMEKPFSDCSMPCPADASQICGKEWRMNIFMATRGMNMSVNWIY